MSDVLACYFPGIIASDEESPVNFRCCSLFPVTASRLFSLSLALSAFTMMSSSNSDLFFFFFLNCVCFLWLASTFGCCVQGCYKYPVKSLLSGPWSLYPEVELWDQMGIPFFIFWGTTLLFSMGAAPIPIPPSNNHSNLPTSSRTLAIFCSLKEIFFE